MSTKYRTSFHLCRPLGAKPNAEVQILVPSGRVYVETDAGDHIVVDRRTARLLARRINQALDAQYARHR